MKEIYSKLNPDLLLHQIFHKKDMVPQERVNISSPDKFLQLASLNLEKGRTFKPHKHIYCEKMTTMAQESWVVIEGSVKVFFYDLDDKIIAEEIIRPGDCSLTYRGGHNYLALEDNTLVYEYKTGPYLGVESDKEFI